MIDSGPTSCFPDGTRNKNIPSVPLILQSQMSMQTPWSFVEAHDEQLLPPAQKDGVSTLPLTLGGERTLPSSSKMKTLHSGQKMAWQVKMLTTTPLSLMSSVQP